MSHKARRTTAGRQNGHGHGRQWFFFSAVRRSGSKLPGPSRNSEAGHDEDDEHQGGRPHRAIVHVRTTIALMSVSEIKIEDRVLKICAEGAGARKNKGQPPRRGIGNGLRQDLNNRMPESFWRLFTSIIHGLFSVNKS